MEQEKINLLIPYISSIAIVLLFIGIAIDLLLRYQKRKKESEEAVLAYQKKIDQLVRQHEVESVNAMLKGQDEERKRISQELHDHLGSLLFTAKLHYKQLEKSIAQLKEQQQKSYNQVTLLLDEATNEVRRISHDLYESSVSQFGFRTALSQLTSAIDEGNSIQIRIVDDGFNYESLKEHGLELYRICQELLSNTLKHAQAKMITFSFSNPESALYQLDYEDDGKGMDPESLQHGSGIGIRNIESRVKKLNGQIFWDLKREKGILCRIKVNQHESDYSS